MTNRDLEIMANERLQAETVALRQRLTNLRAASAALLPFIHEDGMVGESAWELAVMRFEAALKAAGAGEA
jgi:hypothetical protein